MSDGTSEIYWLKFVVKILFCLIKFFKFLFDNKEHKHVNKFVNFKLKWERVYKPYEANTKILSKLKLLIINSKL